MPGTDYELAINVHICSVVPGRSASYENQAKLKPCSAGIVLGWVTKYEYPVLQELFFFSPTFSKAILRSAELLSVCNVVSSIYQLFVPHFAMVIFMFIIHQIFSLARD